MGFAPDNNRCSESQCFSDFLMPIAFASWNLGGPSLAPLPSAEESFGDLGQFSIVGSWAN